MRPCWILEDPRAWNPRQTRDYWTLCSGLLPDFVVRTSWPTLLQSTSLLQCKLCICRSHRDPGWSQMKTDPQMIPNSSFKRSTDFQKQDINMINPNLFVIVLTKRIVIYQNVRIRIIWKHYHNQSKKNIIIRVCIVIMSHQEY